MMDDLDAIHEQLRRCTRCQAAGHPVQGPPIFSGRSSARVMVVGQAPGHTEAGKTLRPFSGSAGARLFRWFQAAGWTEAEARASFYITSITKCFPGAHPSGRGDRPPSRAEQRLCADWLETEVALVDPEVVITVGALAAERFLGPGRKLDDIVGQRFQIDGRIVTPLPHPSGASSWVHDPAHRLLIDAALNHLRQIKQGL